ncbi:hypothetical protein LTR08_009233 [Meristemomyces frigidus]|nr:hypothetical protein LTR08_009233 [Meristemomyces frigidus]
MAVQRNMPRPVHLILDWDGTLTAKDSLSVLARLPRARDARLGIPHHPSHDWDADFVKPYLEDYSALQQAFTLLPTAASNPAHYSQWLASLHPVEYASAARVSTSGFFRGVTGADVDTVARVALRDGELQLRNGWRELFRMFLPAASPPSGSMVSVLSVNWSATFIRSSLMQAAGALHADDAERQQLVEYIEGIHITANEIDGLQNEARGSSGKLIGDIRTAAEKLKHVLTAAGHGDASTHPLTLYVGDSATDYDTLRHAEVGIWICACAESAYKQKLRDTFKPLELDVLPIDQFQFSRGDDHTSFYWTRSLSEVAELIAKLPAVHPC